MDGQIDPCQIMKQEQCKYKFEGIVPLLLLVCNEVELLLETNYR